MARFRLKKYFALFTCGHSRKFYNLLHPVLFALYPVLHLFFGNYKNLLITDIILPQAIIIIFTILLWVIVFHLLKSEIKASLVTSFLLLTVFSYGMFMAILNKIVFSGLYINLKKYSIIIYLAVWLITLIYIIISKRRFVTLSCALLIIACVVNLLNIGTLFVREIMPHKEEISRNNTLIKIDNDLKGKSPQRDIYYLILDGYASAATLKRIYNYDNNEFLDYLRKKGFYIAGNSHSNYAFTALSIPSSLSMNYYNIPTRSNNPNNIELYRNKENEVLKFVKAMGYKYVKIEAINFFKKFHQNVDLSFYDQGSLYFSMILLRQTALDPFLIRLGFYDEYSRQSVIKVLEGLKKSKDIAGPIFVYAHVICPHPPYVFGPNGQKVKGFTTDINSTLYKMSWDEKKGYFNQILFINKKIRLLLDHLLVEGSSKQPIVIIQADHGPGFTQLQAKDQYFYETQLSILNAYYLPDGGTKCLYSSITPVNTFRIVFNYYFNSNYVLLPDRSFYSDFRKPFDFENTIDHSSAGQNVCENMAK